MNSEQRESSRPPSHAILYALDAERDGQGTIQQRQYNASHRALQRNCDFQRTCVRHATLDSVLYSFGFDENK